MCEGEGTGAGEERGEREGAISTCPSVSPLPTLLYSALLGRVSDARTNLGFPSPSPSCYGVAFHM